MMQDKSRAKLIVQRRIVFVSLILLVGKVVAYLLTNSVSVLTDALESIVNVSTGFISLYSLSIALKPKDSNHPFGHGKIESLSASVEGLLIILAGIIIIFEAIKRLFIPAEIQQLDTGIIIVGVAGLCNYILGHFSIKTGKEHNSVALVAGGKHLQSDTYSTIGLIIGLVIIILTGKVWIDSIIAMLFGSIIIVTGIRILRETTSNLMDEADSGQIAEIVEIIRDNRQEKWIEIHHLRLVKYGDSHHMDCDMTLPWYMNINEAHQESDKLKNVIKKNYSSNIDLTVHTDACHAGLCRFCEISSCDVREASHDSTLEWTVEMMTRHAPQIKRIN